MWGPIHSAEEGLGTGEAGRSRALNCKHQRRRRWQSFLSRPLCPVCYAFILTVLELITQPFFKDEHAEVLITREICSNNMRRSRARRGDRLRRRDPRPHSRGARSSPGVFIRGETEERRYRR